MSKGNPAQSTAAGKICPVAIGLHRNTGAVTHAAEYSSRDNFVDFAGRFAYNDKGEEVVNFGKHKGRLVKDVLRIEPSYYNWMMQSDFTMNTKQVLTRLKYKYSM